MCRRSIIENMFGRGFDSRHLHKVTKTKTATSQEVAAINERLEAFRFNKIKFMSLIHQKGEETVEYAIIPVGCWDNRIISTKSRALCDTVFLGHIRLQKSILRVKLS